MRKLLILVLVVSACFAGATFKDPRKLEHPVAPLSQEEVARQQALQKQIGQVGGVPGRTDSSGYAPEFQDDPKAAAVIAGHLNNTNPDSAAEGILSNEQNMKAEQARPAKSAFGAIWALLAGVVLSVGAWAGMNKFGPKPPPHLAR